jgi:hypothetical protein
MLPNDILLAKLERMGIQGTALEWFKNYLSERSMVVDMNGSFSNPCSLDISVIQGSILGRILFLCYINDFWSITTLFSAVLRIHDILGWIRNRIRGSMPLINGSGSGYFRHGPSRCQQKTNFLTQFFLLITF